MPIRLNDILAGLSNNTLTSINLRWNNIGDEGAKTIAEALKTNYPVTSINLTNNNIGAKGAQAIAEALKANKTLTSINFQSNNIGDEGAKAIAEALALNNTLSSINLWYNNIGDAGAKAIAEALALKNSITSINLCSNGIDENGAEALLAALMNNYTLTSISLGENSISPTLLAKINQRIEFNKILAPLKNLGFDLTRSDNEIFKSFIIAKNRYSLLEKFVNNDLDKITENVAEVLDKCILATDAAKCITPLAQEAYKKLSAVTDNVLEPLAEQAIENLCKNFYTLRPLLFLGLFEPFTPYRPLDERLKYNATFASVLASLKSVGLDHHQCYNDIIKSFRIFNTIDEITYKYTKENQYRMAELIPEVFIKCILATNNQNKTNQVAKSAYATLLAIQDEELIPVAQSVIAHIKKTVENINPLFYSEKFQAIRQAQGSPPSIISVEIDNRTPPSP